MTVDPSFPQVETRLGRHQNGKLLALAQEEYDVFLTADSNLSFPQNTNKFRIAIVGAD